VGLQALQLNNMPYANHGIEVLYRFARFDPFCRSEYFGCALLPHFQFGCNDAAGLKLSCSHELVCSTWAWRVLRLRTADKSMNIIE
jgi:hypothetical protein